MTVHELSTNFKTELSGYYPPEEVRAMLYLVFSHIKSWSKTQVLTNKGIQLTEDETIKVQEIIERLQKFEPIQYILSYTEFFELNIKTVPGVLIPRPETEELIYYLAEKYPADAKLDILDVGTGSGCIALALKKQFPKAVLSACDISTVALQAAKENSNKLNLPVYFFYADILTGLRLFPPKQYDIIVSNPPYIRNSEKKLMSKNVLDYEPETALFVSDQNPLVFYKSLIDISQKHLKKGGLLAVEINEFLGQEVRDLFMKRYLKYVKIKTDINGKERFAFGYKK